MDAVRRFVDQLKRKRAGRDAAVPQVIRAAETYVDTIPPAPINVISGDMKKWARRAKIALRSVEGIWWFSGDTLARAQQGGGRVGLHFHGGGYVLGSVKDVRSGFARKFCSIACCAFTDIAGAYTCTGIPRGFVEVRIQSWLWRS